jgi:ADP-ribose pyrophosphatase YjhB (NUDIX family)
MNINEPRNSKGQTLSEFLAAYDENKYRRPSVTADIAVFTLLKSGQGFRVGTLLVKRGDHPYIGKWALPGGFVNMDEDLPEAAARELFEETGLRGLPLRQFGAFGKVDRDPRTRVITTGFYAVAPFGSLSPEAGDDASDTELFETELRPVSISGKAVTYRISLSGREKLACKAQLRFDPLGARTAFLKQGDLAADHSHVLFSALYALCGQPRYRIARLLSGDRPELTRKALEALEQLRF